MTETIVLKRALYRGFNYRMQFVFIDIKNPSPDPPKLMYWGYGMIDDTVSDFKRSFEMLQGDYTLTFEIPQRATALAVKKARVEAIRNYIKNVYVPTRD